MCWLPDPLNGARSRAARTFLAQQLLQQRCAAAAGAAAAQQLPRLERGLAAEERLVSVKGGAVVRGQRAQHAREPRRLRARDGGVVKGGRWVRSGAACGAGLQSGRGVEAAASAPAWLCGAPAARWPRCRRELRRRRRSA